VVGARGYSEGLESFAGQLNVSGVRTVLPPIFLFVALPCIASSAPVSEAD